jgi:SagB-type dehydrogenase family enzyme
MKLPESVESLPRQNHEPGHNPDPLPSLFSVCPTVELRMIGSEFYIFRARDRTCWEADISRDSRFWKIWRHFSVPATVSSFFEITPPEQRQSISKAVDDLIFSGILEPFNGYEGIDALLCEPALQNQPKSLSYHLSSSKIEWVNYSNKDEIRLKDHALMDRMLIDEPAPPRHKKAANSLPNTELPAVLPKEAFQSAPLATSLVSWKSDGFPSRITIDTLTFLINFTFQRTGFVAMYGTGEHFTKSVPSGGARHPIEAYVLVEETLEGIARGAYHYNTNAHRLDQIRISSQQLQRAIRASAPLPTSRGRKIAAAILHTCVFDRSMYRYREPRSYRVLHLDLGHIHANEAICGRYLGLSFKTNYSVPETPIESCLFLDPLRESVMSSFVIFHRE